MKDYLKTMRQQAVQQQLQTAPNTSPTPAQTYEANIIALQSLVGVENPDGKFGKNTFTKLEEFANDSKNSGNPKLELVKKVIDLAKNEDLDKGNDKGKYKLNNDQEFITGVNDIVANATNAEAQTAATLTYTPKQFVDGKDSAGIKISSYQDLLNEVTKVDNNSQTSKSDKIIDLLATAAATGPDGNVDQAKQASYKKLFEQNKDSVIKEFATQVELSGVLSLVAEGKSLETASEIPGKRLDKIAETNGSLVIGGVEIKASAIIKANQATPLAQGYGLLDFDEDNVIKPAAKKVKDENPELFKSKGFWNDLSSKLPDGELKDIINLIASIIETLHGNKQTQTQSLTRDPVSDAQSAAEKGADVVTPSQPTAENSGEYIAKTKEGVKIQQKTKERVDKTLAKADARQDEKDAKQTAEELTAKRQNAREIKKVEAEYTEAVHETKLELAKQRTQEKIASMDHDGDHLNNISTQETKLLNNLSSLLERQDQLLNNGTSNGLGDLESSKKALEVLGKFNNQQENKNSAYNRLVENLSGEGNQLTANVLDAVSTGIKENLTKEELITYNLITSLSSNLSSIGVVAKELDSNSFTPATPKNIADKLVDGVLR